MSNLSVEDRRAAILSMGPELPLAPVLADKFNVHDTTIHSDLRALRGKGHELKLSNREKALSKDEKADARKDYGDGVPMHEMVRRYGVDSTHLRNICSGVLRPALTKPPQPNPSHSEMRADCKSITYAATKQRAREFQQGYRAACRGKASKTGSRPGMTSSQERAYAATIWASLGGKKGKAA